MVGPGLWKVTAQAVPSRLWLGGVLSGRDGKRLAGVVHVVRQYARNLAILVVLMAESVTSGPS
jgi:hypothetical protein